MPATLEKLKHFHLPVGTATAFAMTSVVFVLMTTAGGPANRDVLLAFGARGTPPVVMSIVFAGAPIVNAAYSIWQHPPAGGLGSRGHPADP